MKEHLKKSYSEWKEADDQNQIEIFDVFNESEIPRDHMKELHISRIVNLAKQFYGIEDIMQMEEYKDQGEIEALYTVITYENKEELVEIAKGVFTKEMFTRQEKAIPEYAWLLYSPLKLFVTSAWARDNDLYSDPKDFLSRHTVIYSPSWGKVEEYNIHEAKTIGYGNISHQDTILALQNAEIHKAFPFQKTSEPEKSFEKFSEKMVEIKEFTLEQLEGRRDIKDWYTSWAGKYGKEFLQKMVDCLRHLSDGNIKNMKKLIASFDEKSGMFTSSRKKNI